MKKRVCEPSSLNPLHQSPDSPPRLLRFRGVLDFDCTSTQGAKIRSMRVALISFGLTGWVPSKCTSWMTQGVKGAKVRRLSLRLRLSLDFMYKMSRHSYISQFQALSFNHDLRYTTAVIIILPAINTNTATTAAISRPRCHQRPSRPPRQSAGSVWRNKSRCFPRI